MKYRTEAIIWRDPSEVIPSHLIKFNALFLIIFNGRLYQCYFKKGNVKRIILATGQEIQSNKIEAWAIMPAVLCKKYKRGENG